MLNLLSITSTIIDKDFAKYYNVFMPMMVEILTNIPSTSVEQKSLRSKTITTIGFLISSVSDEKQTFFKNVVEIATYLTQLLKSGLSNDDP